MISEDSGDQRANSAEQTFIRDEQRVVFTCQQHHYVFLVGKTPPPSNRYHGVMENQRAPRNDLAEKFCRKTLLYRFVKKCSVWRAGEACEQDRIGCETLQSKDGMFALKSACTFTPRHINGEET